ncbi:MAG: cytotoxic translational repressor of toxin-antitoxin stability system [Verrucomicrobia bacterium]|nr:cytotoxic translational repressor of toxin-antitoxin stability system [Verrucomicrobiota bacterium]
MRLSNYAQKQYEKLRRAGHRPSINSLIDFLLVELAEEGPIRKNWPNYGKLSENMHHCHLKKGRPTYVACWVVVSEKEKKIEVFYVGTHEGAPY